MNDHLMRIRVPGTITPSNSVEAEFLLCGTPHRVYFRRTDDAILSGNVESFLAAGILPAMRAGSDALIAEGYVSRTFLDGLSTIQGIYHRWDPSLHRVEVSGAIPGPQSGSTGDRVGSFFSGGVDSFYTFLRHQDEITDLIFVHGFDIRLDNGSVRDKASAKVREVASVFGKNVIEIETNIRELLDPYVDWGVLGHGAALAAIGHLLAPSLRRIFIPASHTYADLFPWGSHPVLDPLWSSESLEFVHDGCEGTRVEKVALLARYDVALQSLRVCWKNPQGSYNCGRCEKCLRTMINLRVNGALERCTTFDEAFDIAHVRRLAVTDESTRSFIRENLDALRKTHADHELEEALHAVLTGPPLAYRAQKRLKAMMRSVVGRLT